MEPWIAKAVILAAGIAMFAIRAPHGSRSRGLRVARSRKGRREAVLLTLAWIGYFLPLIWAVSPVLSFGDYPLHVGAFAAGGVCLVVGLWVFHRSHVDLGTNWLAGPSYLLAMAILFAFRVGAEEQMMLETFGNEYAAYMAKTKRLVPGVW
jgi:protein-S-isoprenylcysteine O-methyltransferase Ste14